MKRILFALRVLRKTPVLTLVVILSLGLGIGANTAMFSLLHQIILRTLPVEQPDELVLLSSPPDFKRGRSSTDSSGNMDSIFSYRIFRGLERRPEGLSGLAAFRSIGANLRVGSQTINGSALLVSGGYFRTLRVTPLVGRLILPEDDIHAAGNAVAVMSYGYWNDRLGGKPDVLNLPIRVNGETFTIIGVTPRNFTSTTFGSEPSIYVPLSFKPRLTPGWDGTNEYHDYWLYLFARLKPGVTRVQAETALNTVYAGLVEDQSKTMTNGDATYIRRFVQSRLTLKEGKHGQSALRDGSKMPLYSLLAATGLVLLIAMANAANLLLGRSAERRKEMAIRIALGAGRSAIIGQSLTEALLLAAGGGLAGLLLAWWTLHLVISQLVGGEAPVYFLTASIDWPVLLFTLGVSMLTGLLFGMHPAWEAARHAAAGTLKDDSGHASSSRRSVRVRRLLVTAQVSISVLLLVETGLFLKSMVNLLHSDLGLKIENLITFRLSPSLNSYTPEQSSALFERVEEQMAAIPGVTSVTGSMVPLLSGSNWGSNLTVEGFAATQDADAHSMFNEVGAGYFGKLGIPLIMGREFTTRDNGAGPKVAIVNQQFARHFFGNRNPLGRKFCPGSGNVTPDIEIVGLVKNSAYAGVKQTPQRLYYVPWRQDKEIRSMSFYVRAGLDSAQLIPQVRRTMAALDPNLPVEELRTFDEQVLQNIRPDRVIVQSATCFAVAATVMAMLGLYGVVAYSVARRRREIGIRVALGARAGMIRYMILREVIVILGLGVATGIPAAMGLARLIESLLFGVKAFDAMVTATAITALVIAALLAGWIPAQRATRVDPIQALRYE